MNVIVSRVGPRQRWANWVRPSVAFAASLGLMLGTMAPAFAEHGGGGHASAGGAHFGGGAHAGGYAGHAGAYGGHAAAYHGSVGAYHGGVAHGAAYHGALSAGAGYHVAARGSYGYPGYGGAHYGYSAGAYWHGGYWHGGFWPGAYYGAGFAWFLPVLPLAYATYWWGGVPYYYANDVYYTWNPGYDGYVATDPPPVADEQGGAQPPMEQPPPEAGSAQVFMYPKNGQSEQQQSTDRRECQQWAASQAGADGANAPDYRRALVACVEGRGYSAQ